MVLANGVWKKLTIDQVIPAAWATAARAGVFAYTTTACTAGFNLDMAGAILTANEDWPIEAFFDGDTTDTTEYGYQWSGAASATTSKRQALVNRPPSMLVWDTGESAWDFIDPLMSSVGFRLFCDEQRKWRLVDEAYIVDGLVTVASGFNASEGREDISRNDESWADAVVVKYSWLNADGAEQVAYDIAKNPSWSRAKLIEYSRPYPGPGAAAYLLSRAQGQGRMMDVAAISSFGATPNMSITVTMPDTEIQSGYVSSVEWDSLTDEMRIGTRGSTDTPASGWSLIPVGEKWSDSPAGQTWANEVIPGA